MQIPRLSSTGFNDLILKYSENGEVKQAAFDLIVILTKPQIALEIRSLRYELGQTIL